MKTRRVHLDIVLWILILTVALPMITTPVSATAGIRYVATSGTDAENDCANSGVPCATLQHAVDVSDNYDEVRIAAGSYSGSATVTVNRFNTDYEYRQVVFIGRPLSLRGGYLETDWNQWDPQVNVTTIDAAGDGRPVSVVDTGEEVVALAGFTLTGGDYTGLGNPADTSNHVCRSRGDEDCGGGLYVYNSALAIENCEVSGNVASTVAGDGGGIYLWKAGSSTLANLLVQQNEAPYMAGGLHAEEQRQPLDIVDSIFTGNTAGQGGGIALATNIEALVTIERSTLSGNSAATGDGGGLYANLTANGDILALNEVSVSDNKAWGKGKAVLVRSAGPYTPHARLTNLLLSGNGPVPGAPETAEEAVLALGPGFTDLEVTLEHVTAAGNTADTFLYVETRPSGDHSINVNAFNTLVSNIANGFAVREVPDGNASVTHTNTLFHNVTNQNLALEGAPELVAVNPMVGDPLLDESFHLQAGSAALDQGVDVGVSHDLDGDHRPQGLAPDIGADEYLELTAPVSVSLSGPSSVDAGVEAEFLAEVSPNSATQPLAYEWSATGLNPISRLGGLSDTANFTWLTPGLKSVHVTVSNDHGEVSESWQITVDLDEIFHDGFESRENLIQLDTAD